MDLTDFIFLVVTRGPFVLPLVYVLAILLRVACHFAAVEIPALGRAMATAAATAGLTTLAAVTVRAWLGEVDSSWPGMMVLFLTLLLSLLANMVVSTGVYRIMLPVTYSQALSVWLIQAVGFLVFTAAAGCLIGVPYAILFD